LLVELVHFFVLTSCEGKWWAKYYTGWLCSQYKWRHNNVVIFKKFKISHKLNTKRIFWIFFIFWKLTNWRRFVNYLWN